MQRRQLQQLAQMNTFHKNLNVEDEARWSEAVAAVASGSRFDDTATALYLGARALAPLFSARFNGYAPPTTTQTE